MNRKQMAWGLCLLAVFISASCSSKRAVRMKQAEAIRSLGEAYLAEKKYSAAYTELMKAREMNPRDSNVYFSLGIFYFERERYPESIEQYRKCLEIKPDFASAWNNLGIVYMAIQDWDSAIACFEELRNNYIYATPHYPLFLTGQAYYYKNQFDQAERYFQEALKVQPDYAFAQHWLGKTFLSLGKVEQAIEILEKLVVGEKENYPVFHYDLGRAYAKAGKRSKACSIFTRLIQNDPDGKVAAIVRQEIGSLNCR